MPYKNPNDPAIGKVHRCPTGEQFYLLATNGKYPEPLRLTGRFVRHRREGVCAEAISDDGTYRSWTNNDGDRLDLNPPERLIYIEHINWPQTTPTK